MEGAVKAEMGHKGTRRKRGIAHETSHIKGYMVAAHNPWIKKAITKEKLTMRGLVSPMDYYLEKML